MDADFTAKLDRAWKAMKEQASCTPSIGLILGSGLGEFAEKVNGTRVPFASLSGFPQPTVAGHAGLFTVGETLAVMAGRVHYYEGHPIDDVILPVFLLHRLGVKTLIVTNAAGGVNREYSPGDLVLIRDHINLMGINPLRGPNPGPGPRFPDMSVGYDPTLRTLAMAVSREPLREGVYAAFSGPSYETPAEIRMLAAIGVDMVGMSTVPEVIAAGYLGIRVLGISCVTNMAAGILPQPLDHAEVIARGKEAGPRFIRLLRGVIERLGGGTFEG